MVGEDTATIFSRNASGILMKLVYIIYLPFDGHPMPDPINGDIFIKISHRNRLFLNANAASLQTAIQGEDNH